VAYGRFLARQAKLPVFAIMASKHSVESRKRAPITDESARLVAKSASTCMVLKGSRAQGR
jgi:hypothetical protein